MSDDETTENINHSLSKRIRAIIKISNEWRVVPKPDVNREEIIECPVCKGKLHLSQSAFNGHVRGRCETEDCIVWME